MMNIMLEIDQNQSAVREIVVGFCQILFEV